MTSQEYRAAALAHEMAAWPQPVQAQTLRTRLAAYKGRLCDANFELGVCSSCAREKRVCKMVHTIFPPLCDDVPPAWLAWAQEEWLLHRETWYGQMDSLLNINTYLEHYFQ